MDRKKGAGFSGKKPGKKNKAAREVEFYQEEEDLQPGAVYGEDEETNWDFRRNLASADGNRFTFTRREPTGRVDGYRVVGQAARETGRAVKGAAMPSATSPQSRPNRYNSGVRMVAADSGPAPWDDWSNISYLKLPVVGEVAAGQYDVTIAYHEPGYGPDADFVLVNSEEVKVSRDTFALRVRGQSMIDNEISDGDIIIVQAQTWAEDGDFVVACLTDGSDPAGFVTLKRFYRHRYNDRVLLQPANQQLGPIHIFPLKGDSGKDDLDGVKIQGKVTAIIKNGWVN